MTFDRRLLEILVCPKCKGDLDCDPECRKFICRNCRLAYQIKDDIPVMLESEAERMDP